MSQNNQNLYAGSFPGLPGQGGPGGYQQPTSPMQGYGGYADPQQQQQQPQQPPQHAGYGMNNMSPLGPGGYGHGGYSGQQFGQQDGYNGHAAYNGTPAGATSGQQGQPADQGFPIPGLNAPGMNTFHMLAAGSNLLSGSQTWGSQYMQRVQQRMGWLSGGALNYHFAISNKYVATKLLILFTPFFRKWNFTRQTDTLQMQGGHKYRPPCVDVNAPDLYIPMVSAWSYVTVLCANALLLGRYKPDIVYYKAWWTGFAWVAHACIAWLLLRMMTLPSSLPWSDLMAYTGYVFVQATNTVVFSHAAWLILGMPAGNWTWWAAWAYGSFCSAVFLVRTIKRVLFQESRGYGPNLTLTNYLLLALAVLQFPLLMWLCHVQLPGWTIYSHDIHTGPGMGKVGMGPGAGMGMGMGMGKSGMGGMGAMPGGTMGRSPMGGMAPSPGLSGGSRAIGKP